MARTRVTGEGAGVQIDVRSRAWRTFLEAHAAVVPLVDQALEREVGLPFTWYDVLFQLAETPTLQLRMGELAKAVLLSRSGLTRLVDRIEGAGLVARKTIPGDRRSSYVVLTEAGQGQLAAALPIATRAIVAYFGSQLSDADASLLVEILGRVRDHASNGQRRGRQPSVQSREADH